MVLIFYGQAYLFGVNDSLVIFFILITTAFLYVSLVKLHAGNRKMLRVNANSGSGLYRFLSKDSTIFLSLVSLFSSFILSVILVVLIKGIVIQQGYLPFFITIVIASLALYSFVNANINSKLINDNLHEDITRHGNDLARIFYSVIILNLILSFAFSAYDTHKFITSDVSFNNLTDKALESSYEKTEFNQYSRIFINAYLLMDHIKIALTNMFVEHFNLKNNFYGFYITIFFLNMFKFFGFSISFVLLQRGFDGAANFLLPFVKKSIEYIKIFISSASQNLSKKYLKNMGG